MATGTGRSALLSAALAISSAGSAFASATDVYITPNGNASGACAMNVQTPAFFNNGANWGGGANQIGPGTTVHLCGTFTGAANGNLLTFQGSGANGNPIRILFDANTQLNAPYWSFNGGAINTNGKGFLTIDGGRVGVIQNTANGDQLANKQSSVGIQAGSCDHCTVENLTIANIYVHVQGSANTNIDQTLVQAVRMGGSNWAVTGNTIHDCGWCLSDPFGNGDTNVEIGGNDIYHFDHALMFAAAAANAATNVFFHDNQVHDPANWDCTNNGCHHDGIHVFGTTGSSVDGFYVYNNYFFGDWGKTPTGFIFIEGGMGTPAHMSNQYYWNNVAVIPAGAIENTNGWFGIFSGESGTTALYNNTVIGPGVTDNTACFNVGGVNDLVFKNNAVHECGDPVNIGNLTNFNGANFDDNFYGVSCNNGNCFVWNGAFKGSFANWKAACGCDASSAQSNNALLGPDGTPLPGSPVLGKGVDLANLAVGSLATLASDTSRGGTRAPVSRPAAGAWDVGAYAGAGTSDGGAGVDAAAGEDLAVVADAAMGAPDLSLSPDLAADGAAPADAGAGQDLSRRADLAHDGDAAADAGTGSSPDGCGCRVGGSRAPSRLPALLLVAGLAGRLRRRRGPRRA